MFRSPSLPQPAPVAPAPTRADPEIAEAARREEIRQQRLRGRAATILTGPSGTPRPQPKRLLGE